MTVGALLVFCALLGGICAAGLWVARRAVRPTVGALPGRPGTGGPTGAPPAVDPILAQVVDCVPDGTGRDTGRWTVTVDPVTADLGTVGLVCTGWDDPDGQPPFTPGNLVLLYPDLGLILDWDIVTGLAVDRHRVTDDDGLAGLIAAAGDGTGGDVPVLLVDGTVRWPAWVFVVRGGAGPRWVTVVPDDGGGNTPDAWVCLRSGDRSRVLCGTVADPPGGGPLQGVPDPDPASALILYIGTPAGDRNRR